MTRKSSEPASNDAVCSVVSPAELREWQATHPDGDSDATAAGRVIASALDRSAPGATLRDDDIVAAWRETFGRDPDRVEKADLLNYWRLFARVLRVSAE